MFVDRAATLDGHMRALMDYRKGRVRAALDRLGGIAPAASASIVRSRLFIKYVILFVAVVGLALVANGAFDIYFSYQEQKTSLVRIQREQAEAAAGKIGQFVSEIERQVGWTTQLPWSAGTLEQRRFDALRLLRQVPAITELAEIDSTGNEQLKVSRLAMEVVGSGNDVSKDPAFIEAVAHKVYYGPVYFRRESEPYMTLSLAGTRRDTGVSIAQVNLKLIWDVLSKIKFAGHGRAYVVDAAGRLIAHPDISLVLRNTDMSQLAQVRSASAAVADNSVEQVQEAEDNEGHRVLTASAPVAPLGWLVFVETPIQEAYAPLYAAMQRTGLVLLGALALAFAAAMFLARRMVVPIQALRSGAARLGSGDLGQRIAIKTGDEVEALADQFNDMAGRLQESYANLEKKVELRTRELSESLEQQTATSEVLQIINSSPGELEPVFETMLRNAVQICGAKFGNLWLREGDSVRIGAAHGAPPAWSNFLSNERRSFRVDPRFGIGRLIRTKETYQVADITAEPTYDDELRTATMELSGARTLIGVPMLAEGEVIGSIVIYRQEVRPFDDKQIDLLKNFAAQAVIAIENTRLLTELRQRTDELGRSVGELRALGEVSQAVNSTLDLETVLSTIVAKAVQLSGTEAGAIYVFDDGQREFHLRATYGMDQELIDALSNSHIGLDETNVAVAAGQQEPIQIADLKEEVPNAINEIILRAGYRARLTAPLFHGGDIVGLLVVRRKTPGEFARSTVDLIKTFAAQSVLAIQNARLFENVETRTGQLTRSLEDLRTAQDRLVQTEKLASLGQLTAGIAHEIKNPLNFVNNFSAVSVELIDELREALGGAHLDTKLRAEIEEIANMLQGNLDKVVQHGKRADSIVKNMLLHSRQGSGEHRPVDINALVEESLNLAYHGARAEKQGFNITLERSFDPAAGEVDLFPQEITRVLLNLISNGFYAATKRKAEANGGDYEPTLAAATKNLGDSVEIRIRDNGTGIPPEVKERMFNPFFTTKPAGEGTGLGLSLSYDIIVKQHAGSIEVDTQPGEFTEFKIVLPRQAATIARPGVRK
jgi:signal transduction histidine kinase/HAMP domain-containing protein